MKIREITGVSSEFGLRVIPIDAWKQPGGAALHRDLPDLARCFRDKKYLRADICEVKVAAIDDTIQSVWQMSVESRLWLTH